jgi:hypothetical protein
MELTQLVIFAVAALVAAAVVVGLSWAFLRSTEDRTLPVLLLLAGFCAEAIFVKQPYVQIGLQIYPNDVISVFVVMAAAVGFVRRAAPITDRLFLLWMAFGGVIMYSFLIGLMEYGKAAGTEVRQFFYLWAAGLLGVTAGFTEQELRKIGRWCTIAAYVFVGIAVYFLIGVETGFISRAEVFGYAGGDLVFRPIGSHYTFFAGAVALAHTMAWLRSTGRTRSGWHAAFLLLFVTLMQHRSVWIAVAIGLLWVAWLERRYLTRRLPLLLGFVLVFGSAATLATWFGYLDSLIAQLVGSTVSMYDSGGTFAARVDGWERLLEDWSESAQTMMIGFPFGYGYSRLYRGQLIEFVAHNHYIDLALRVGIVGVVLFMVPTIIAVVGCLRAKTDSEFEYMLMRSLAVALIAAFVYYVAYPSFYLLGGATGIALAQLIRRREAALKSPATGLPWLRVETATRTGFAERAGIGPRARERVRH